MHLEENLTHDSEATKMAKLYSIPKVVGVCVFAVSTMTAVVGLVTIWKIGLSQTLVIVTVTAGCVAVTVCPAVTVIYLAYSPSTPTSMPVPSTHDDPPPAYRLTWGREYPKHIPSEQDREAGTPSSEEHFGEPKDIWTTTTDQLSGVNRIQSPLQAPGVHTFTRGGEGAAPSTHCRCQSRSHMYSYCNEEAVWKRGVVPSTLDGLRDDQGLPSYEEAVEGI
ncbi:uncharacterized protein LOC125044351 [Penaeus chinensis]|uniref:uncharacterized protein LOC125044351 n=1 Tax=Penaeus chinensis TaxID=139456 RepID=UPI001FB5EA99|nr:uncharacterized protein LOC125044351 [Penaeus chinensis]